MEPGDSGLALAVTLGRDDAGAFLAPGAPAFFGVDWRGGGDVGERSLKIVARGTR